MQVVARGLNEGLTIGEGIHVNVLEIDEQWVRLEIYTPDAEPAYRIETVYFTAEDETDSLTEQTTHRELATLA